MRHIFYNVGHAETILIQPDPQTIIVRDFGKNKKANQDYYYNYGMAYNDIISAHNDNYNIDAVISPVRLVMRYWVSAGRDAPWHVSTKRMPLAGLGYMENEADAKCSSSPT